jgi:hypothetical protein
LPIIIFMKLMSLNLQIDTLPSSKLIMVFFTTCGVCKAGLRHACSYFIGGWEWDSWTP